MYINLGHNLIKMSLIRNYTIVKSIQNYSIVRDVPLVCNKKLYDQYDLQRVKTQFSKSFISAAIYGECGGNYAGVRGHLASPGFPFKDYPADQDCEWVIEVPTNLFVEVSKSGDAHTFCNENKGKSGRSKLPVIDL